MRCCGRALAGLVVWVLAGSALAAGGAEPDERLARKVSAECVGGRFGAVVDRVATETGVVVRAGTSSSDWKVRDLPALVCAQDMSLGRLLAAIADANRLLLSSSKDSEGVVSYRLWRDKKRQMELEAFEKEKADALFAAAYYDWEMLSRLRTSEPDENGVTGASKRSWPGEIVAAANLLCELGPEVRERVLNGEPVLLTSQTAPASLMPHFRGAIKACYDAHSKDRPVAMTEEALKQSYIKIEVEDYGKDADELSVTFYSKGAGGVRRIVPFEYQSIMRMDDPDMPARPKVSRETQVAGDLGSRYVRLIAASSDAKVLETKVKVDLPKGKEKPTYSELLVGVSKATGYSIVAEGRGARWVLTPSDRTKLMGLFGREISVREALALAENGENQDWYLDEQSKLILGRDRQWARHQRALVPEKLLVEMQSKLKGDGVELDDLKPLVGLSEEQIYDWIGSCPEYPEVQGLYGVANAVSDSFLGALYFALDTRERTAAKAGRDVSLENVDKGWMAGLLRAHVAREAEFALAFPEGATASATDLLKCGSVLADSDSLPDLRLRVEKTALPEQSRFAGRHQYNFIVDGPEGSGIAMSWRMPGMFPIVAAKAEGK